MSIARIRGEQIQNGILRQNHFAADAQLPESILAIDYHKHTETLEDKKVIYKVQVNDKEVGGLSELDLSGIVNGTAVTSSSSEEGVIIDAPKNKVTLRDGKTQDTPLKDIHGDVVYGRLVENGTGGFKVLFFTLEGDVETPYTMEDGQTIDFIYYKRGNVLNIPEDFLITEGGSFVEGATDAVADFDLKQLAKELGITLNHEGNMTLSRSVIEEILVQTRGVANSTVRANTVIDEVVLARNGKDSLGSELVSIRQSISDETAARTASISESVTALNKSISDEVSRAEGVESGLRSDLDSEILRSKGVEATIQTALGNEVTRALGAETALDVKISTEKARAEEVETGLRSDLEAEKARALAAESGLQTAIDSLSSNMSDNLQVAIDNEVARATGVETGLQSALDADKADLTAYKTSNDTRISSIETKNTEQDGRLDTVTANLTQEVLDRTAAISGIKNDLASVENGKGASLIGIEDLENVLAATNVEAALKELYDKVVTEEKTRASADSAIDIRVTKIETEAKKLHSHDRYIFQASGNETFVDLPNGKVADSNTLSVTINGLEQCLGVHYSENVNLDGNATGVTFSPDKLVTGDIVILKWVNVTKLF